MRLLAQNVSGAEIRSETDQTGGFPCGNPCIAKEHREGIDEAGLHGTYHHVSVKHLGRYVGEFSGRHNDRPSDTTDQMDHMVKNAVGTRLRYKDLIA